MSTKKRFIGSAIACAGVFAVVALCESQASADDTRLTVTPAVYRTADGDDHGATVQLARWGGGRGWGGGYRGGWGGGYRGYGWGGGYRGWGGYGYRPFYRPYYGGFGYGLGYGLGSGLGYGAYGYGNPGYGYGYGYPAYGYGYPGYGGVGVGIW